jgi:regulator of cell morphogenesis and NO signaling
MSQLSSKTNVGQWVAQHPVTARVFESLGIDYCCGGKLPLEKACHDRRLGPEAVVRQLLAVVSTADSVTESWTDASLTDLCDHIEMTHHAYLKSELPRLAGLIAKVVNAHGVGHPELAQLLQVFLDLRAELEPHMLKEERVLFPAIRALEAAAARAHFPCGGSLAQPIHVMEVEHEFAGRCLAEMRELTSDFRVPEGACNTYRVMLASLEELEADMHEHVHKENNILFPRAARLENLQAA